MPTLFAPGHEVLVTRVARPVREGRVGEDGQTMSLLINRATTSGSSNSSGTTAAPAGRPVALAAAFAGATAAVVGLVVCMSVALTGWFLADAGAHGDTTDALRVGADAWLVGHGSDLLLAGVPLGMTPLAVTMVVVLTAFRCGRWAAVHAEAPGDDRVLATAAGLFTSAYVVVAVITCVLAAETGAQPSLGRAVVGALLVGAVAGGAGLAAGCDRLATWVDAAPRWLVDVVTGGLAGVLALVAAGALLVGGALLVSVNEAATVLSELQLSAGEALSFTVVMALFAPNVALLGSAYLLGPGFAVGTGTTVSPTAVSLGVVPAFPVLAALPDEGPTPGWLVAALAVPVVAAGAGAASTLRRRAPIAHDLAALRGAGAGFVAGVLVTVMIALAGGPLGTGRMADIGAPAAEVLVFATGLMSIGGLVGAVAQNAWRRHRGVPGEVVTSPPPRRRAPDPRPDDGDEPTVEVLR